MAFKHFQAFLSDATGPIQGSILNDSNLLITWETYGRFFTGFEATIDAWTYKNVLDEIETKMNLIGLGTMSLQYDYSTDKVILSSSQPRQFTFNVASQRILGFSSSYASTQVITGGFVPWYVWNSSNDARSNDTEVYERNPIYTERIAESGLSYSTGVKKTVLCRDWDFVDEPKEKIHEQWATVEEPFTFDLWLQNLRNGPNPFVVFNNVDSLDYNQRDGTYEMIPETSLFVPRRSIKNYQDYWDISFKTRLLSRPNQSTI